MKKFTLIVLAVLVLAAISTAIYRFNFRKHIPQNVSDENQVVAILKQNDCLACHDYDAQEPYYGKWPVIGKWTARHMEQGVRFCDLHAIVIDPDCTDEAALAKIEHAVATGSMPVLAYRLIHWGTGFNRTEKSILTRWIQNLRSRLFSTKLAAEAFANEPIQPLVATVATDSAKVALGHRLFLDGRLSLNGSINCATCHILEDGGADLAEERVSKGIHDLEGKVNAPTVYNALFHCRQFWNGRAVTLAEQAKGPMTNPVEMGDQTLDDVVARLGKDQALVAEFAKLYPNEGLTSTTLTDAIAQFEMTLITPDSPFDRYLKGDLNAITENQKKGYEVFKKYACATCHVGQAMGGQSFEYMGIKEDYFASRPASIPTVPDDKGLNSFTNRRQDLFKFKTPSLRNITLTRPYFHDGSIETLDEAVKAMLRFEIGEKASQHEVDQMVDFMGTLTGKNVYLKK